MKHFAYTIRQQHLWRAAMIITVLVFGIFVSHPIGTHATTPLDYASNLDTIATDAGLPKENQTPTKIVLNGIRVFMGLLGIIAMVLIIYGGFLMLTSGGNEDRIGNGKKIVTWAVIGIIIIMSSLGILQFLDAQLFT